MRGVYAFACSHFDNQDKIIGVELGVHLGLNAFEHLVKYPKLHLHCVDNYTWPGAQVNMEWAVYVLTPFKDRITFHYKDSVEAAAEVADGSVDFVYIDADHTYNSVKRDIDAWLPKVKPGGVIGGHDFYTGKFALANGVFSAVAKRFAGCEVLNTRSGGDWWVKL